MKNAFRTLVVGTVLAVAGISYTLAADAPDPVVGTWTLNLAKSTFETGKAPKSMTRVYTRDADGISLSVKGVAADGSAISQQATFKYDGKPYNMSGATEYDALSLKRINGSAVSTVMMKAGKKVGTTMRSVSGHGKVLTLSSKVMGADGKPHSSVAVYDKQ